MSPAVPGIDQILKRLKTELKLNPEQEAGISRIFKDAQTEIRAAYRAGGAEEAKAKFKELRTRSRMKIRSLLTEEQKNKYDQMGRHLEAGEGQAPVYKVWTPVPGEKPVPVEITTGISDGSSTEVVSGGLKEGQEVIVDTLAGNSKPGAAPTSPSMRGFR